MTNEAIIIVCTAAVTVGGLVAWVLREMRCIRSELVELKIQLGISPSRTVHDTIREEIREHAAMCPAMRSREP